MPRLRAILFDLDRTLLDRDASVLSFVSAQYEAFRPRLDGVERAAFIDAFVRLDARGSVWKDIVYQRLTAELHIHSVSWGELFADFEARIVDHYVPFPGMRRTLEELSMNYRLGLITNGRAAFQSRTIQKLNIASFFSAILISEAEGVRKPDSQIFCRALNRLNVTPSEAVYVGDHPLTDVKAARDAGMLAFWKRNDDFNDVPCDGVVDDLSDILRLMFIPPKQRHSMKSATQGILKHDHLEALLAPYDLRMEDVQFLRYSQNHVYLCRHHNRKAILRISEGRHRAKEQIKAELAWMTFLIGHGIKACSPIATQDGEVCVALDLDVKAYIVACFEHVPGSPIMPQNLSEGLYEGLGRLLGQMHALTAACVASPLAAARPHWHESRLLREDREQLGARLPRRFCDSVDDLIQQLRKLPAGPDTYGLVHGDFSLGNCHLDGSDLWLFDFDNCEQGHFTQELATVLYDSIYCKVLNKFADSGLNDRIAGFWQPFWQGYCKTGSAKPLDPVHLQKFFLLREAIIYIHYHRVLDLRRMDASFHAGLEVMRTNVENQEHQVDFFIHRRGI